MGNTNNITKGAAAGSLRPAAEGIREGGATASCVNLYRRSADGALRVMPRGFHDESVAGEGASAGVVRQPGQYEAVRIYAVGAGPITQRVEQSVLEVAAGNPRGVVIPAAASLERYSRLVADAYGQMSARAVAAGLFVQPVLAAYRLLDAGGRELFCSLPVAVGLPEGWQCTGAFETAASVDGDSLTLGAFSLEAEAFELRADIPGYDPAEVGAVELLLSPQLHPFDPKALCALRVEGNGEQNYGAAVAMPGATAFFASLDRVRLRSVMLLAGRGAGVLTVAGRAGSTRGTIGIEPAVMDSAEAEVKAVAASAVAVEPEAGEAAMLLRRCKSPAGFAARARLESGDTVVYAGITPLTWSGPDPAVLIVPPERGEQPAAMTEADAVVTVTDASGAVMAVCGRRVSVQAEGPLRMVALAGYPSARAARIRLEVRRGGEVLAAERTLSAVPSQEMALGVAPGLRQPELEASAAVEATAPVAEREREGMALVARSSDPWRLLSAMELCGGRVQWMAAADRTASAWDAARCRFYAAGPHGVYAAEAGASGECGATLIAPGGAGCVAAGPSGVLLGRGSGLYRLDNARLKLLADLPDDVVDIAAVSHGLTAVDCADSKRWLLSADFGERWLMDGADPERVEWSAAVTVAPGVRPVALWVDMTASLFRGEVELASGAGEVLCSVSIDSALRRPVYLRSIEAPHRARLVVRVAGRVSADFRLGAVCVTTAASGHD